MKFLHQIVSRQPVYPRHCHGYSSMSLQLFNTLNSLVTSVQEFATK